MFFIFSFLFCFFASETDADLASQIGSLKWRPSPCPNCDDTCANKPFFTCKYTCDDPNEQYPLCDQHFDPLIEGAYRCCEALKKCHVERYNYVKRDDEKSKHPIVEFRMYVNFYYSILWLMISPKSIHFSDKHCAFEYDLYTKTELVKFNMEEFIVKAVQGGLKGKVIEKNLFNFC
uniref:Uncharacterized protein n=1 Tax=Meloidogyne enterolobii TaxID=390850 RepID=A0A6V7XB51_MELEN|nr:unnamed protein product [Meloidogyne enterolobii]